MVRSLLINQKWEIRTNLIGLRELYCIAGFLAVVTNWWVIRLGANLLIGDQQIASTQAVPGAHR
jgi:hypothetical protein